MTARARFAREMAPCTPKPNQVPSERHAAPPGLVRLLNERAGYKHFAPLARDAGQTQVDALKQVDKHVAPLALNAGQTELGALKRLQDGSSQENTARTVVPTERGFSSRVFGLFGDRGANPAAREDERKTVTCPGAARRDGGQRNASGRRARRFRRRCSGRRQGTHTSVPASP